MQDIQREIHIQDDDIVISMLENTAEYLGGKVSNNYGALGLFGTLVT